jgi:hypothetical protein
MKFIELKKSNDGKTKYEAVFLNTKTNKLKTVKFGAIKKNGEPYEDFTIHKDEERKKRYIERHSKNEDWNNAYTRGALSRWILWNKETISESLKDYLDRFKELRL